MYKNQLNNPMWNPLWGGQMLFARFNEEPPAGEPDSGTGGGESTPTTEDDSSGSTFTVKVDGVDKEVTLNELREGYSKSAGADKRFEEASQLSKEAAGGKRITDLANKMKSGEAGPADVTEFVNLLGGDAADMDMSQFEQGGVAPQQPVQAVQGAQGAQEDSQIINRERLDEGTRRTLEKAESAEMDRIRQNIETEMKKGIDNDEALSKILGVASDDDRDGRRSELYDMAMEIVKDRVCVQGKVFGPQMIKEISLHLRARIKRLGTPTTPKDIPASQYGPGNQGTTPTIDLNKQTERKSSTEPDYMENVVERTMQNQQRLALKRR